MDTRTILAKTAKGAEEIQQRTHRLPHKLRALLIMVDGRLDVATLIDRALLLGDVAHMLRELQEQGFIEVPGVRPAAAPAVAAAAAAPAAADPAPAVAPDAPVTPEGLADAKRYMSGFLWEVFGPMASGLVARVERCASRQDVVDCLEACLKSLEKKVRADKYNEFRSRVMSALS